MIRKKKEEPKTFEWKSSKIKSIFDDFDAKIDTRNVLGTAGNKRTEVITVKPGDTLETIEIIGVNNDVDISSDRKNADIHYIEIRGAIDSTDEQILIANSIIKSRLEKMGFDVVEKERFKKSWMGVNYRNN